MAVREGQATSASRKPGAQEQLAQLIPEGSFWRIAAQEYPTLKKLYWFTLIAASLALIGAEIARHREGSVGGLFQALLGIWLYAGSCYWVGSPRPEAHRLKNIVFSIPAFFAYTAALAGIYVCVGVAITGETAWTRGSPRLGLGMLCLALLQLVLISWIGFAGYVARCSAPIALSALGLGIVCMTKFGFELGGGVVALVYPAVTILPLLLFASSGLSLLGVLAADGTSASPSSQTAPSNEATPSR